ncbi:MAG: hypothetical protein AB4911_21100 [Oscillochloridaceae bacterium umkhey_bin13]
MDHGKEAPDVAAILTALRAEVRQQRAALNNDEEGTALGAIERELRHCAEQLEVTRVVSAHWPIEGGNLYTRAWALVHKVVRRSLSWYIPPIVAQQNSFNEAAARSLSLLIESNLELRTRLATLEAATTPPDGSPPLSGAQPAQPTAPQVPQDELRRLAQVSAHQQLGASPAALVQRSVRQYLRWMINPIVEQQNAANDALATALPLLAAAEAELRTRLTKPHEPNR